MESLETESGSQVRTSVVTICNEGVSTEQLEKAVSEDQNAAGEVSSSQSKSDEVEAVPTILRSQDVQINIQCSEFSHESTLPVQLTPEMLDPLSSTEMSPVERRAALENPEAILKSFSVASDDDCGASKSCDANCNDDLEAILISEDQSKDTTLQEDSGSPSEMAVGESPMLPSDATSEALNTSLQEINASSQETIVTLQEASIILQKTIDSSEESSVSTQQTAVLSQSGSVSSRESTPEVCGSSQEATASVQGTSVDKQETTLDEKVVEEKVLSCGLDLVCDNDSEETLCEGHAEVKSSSRLADLDSSSGPDTLVIIKQKRNRTPGRVTPSSDKVPIATSTKPEWLKPFEEGWRREVVLRKEVVTSGVRPADIYYYTPSGKKLRSTPEICLHLKENKCSLDVNCFTFSKCAIYKEPFETVRSAGEPGGKSAKSSPILRSSLSLKRSPSSSLTRVKKMLKTVGAASLTEVLPKKDLISLPKKRSMPVEDSQRNGSDTKRCKFVEKVEKNSPVDAGQRLCGLSCPGSEGVAPTIPCDNCMCMFHATCIWLSATCTSFTCQTCQIQQKTSKAAALVPPCTSLAIPSLRPISLHTTAKQRSVIRGPPPLQRANTSLRAPPTLVIAPTQVPPPMILPMHLIKPFCVTTSSCLPMHSTLPANPQSGVSIGSIATIGSLVQPSTIISQPTRQLRLVLPPKVVNQLNLNKPLALKINGQQLLLQPNEFIPIANGIKVLLPENLIAKSCPTADPVNKSVSGTGRINKSKAPILGGAGDKGHICIIDPDLSVPSTVAVKSSYVTSVPLTVKMSLENVNGKSSSQLLMDTSAAKQSLEAALEKCLLPYGVSSNAQSVGAGDEPRTSAAQMPLALEKINSVALNSDAAGSVLESHPVVIRVDSDTDSDSDLPEPCEPPIDVSKVVSSAPCVVLPPYLIVPISSANLSTASATSCQSTSSCNTSSVPLAVLGLSAASATSSRSTTSEALTTQPPLLTSCILSYATSTVSSTLPIFCEGVSDAGSTSLSSMPILTREVLTPSDPSGNHSKEMPDLAARTEEMSETVIDSVQVDSVASKRCTAFKRAWSNFGMLHAGYNSMFHIFQHLGVCDLLRAAAVCRTWNTMIKDAKLWRSIGFRGCRIKSWQQAAIHFQRMNTRHLDFRGMLQSGDGSCTWLSIAENLPRLSALQQVDFGQCSAEVLSASAEACPNLQSVTAEIVTLNSSDSSSGSSCPEFDPTKLSNLHELVCLKVRGVPGITLPSDSDAKTLQNLSSLTKLQNLSLITLRGVEGKDFSFIESLSQLRILELGNCLNWTKETFGNLATLVNLTNLRLECGGDPVDAGLGDALKKLTNLQNLELIRYFVADNLAIIFPTLTHLKTFFIWPELQENEAQVGRQNSIILSAVSGMPFLQRLFWGITIESQTSAEDASSAVSRQATIPFLLRGSLSVDQRTLSTRRLTIQEIVSALSDRLPSTEIRVFQVPAQSHQIHSH